MSLVTRCPKCQNDFLASLDQLRMHDGLVRCGNCANIFDAYAHLESELPTLTRRAGQEHAELPPPRSSLPQYGQTPDPVFEPVVQPVLQPVIEPVFESVVNSSEPVIHDYVVDAAEPAVLRHRTNAFSDASSPAQQGLREPSLSIHAEPRVGRAHADIYGRGQPDFLLESEGHSVWVRTLWGIASLLAVLALLGQAVFIYRNDIATRLPFVQPVLHALCAKLSCDVSLSRHLERIYIEGSSLQLSGSIAQEGLPVEFALRLTMRNRYDKNQPWPHLSLELKDASGTTVVRKTIAPYQYLPSTLIDQPFAAGQEVNLLIPVSVNGLHINGFQLDKFFP